MSRAVFAYLRTRSAIFTGATFGCVGGAIGERIFTDTRTVSSAIGIALLGTFRAIFTGTQDALSRCAPLGHHHLFTQAVAERTSLFITHLRSGFAIFTNTRLAATGHTGGWQPSIGNDTLASAEGIALFQTGL